jgi:hypothetical protein
LLKNTWLLNLDLEVNRPVGDALIVIIIKKEEVNEAKFVIHVKFNLKGNGGAHMLLNEMITSPISER